jgi:hypothetical protein
MKRILKKIPTEEEIDMIIDEGNEVEIWIEGDDIVVDVSCK